jgi:biopolymer transport protein ExbD
MEFERRMRKPRPVTVISLIDIMFVLLLFFMVAGHLEKPPIVPIELPKADAGQLLEEGPIEVVLGKYDEVLINDEMVEGSKVMEALKRQLAINPERIITLKADASLEANRLVSIMETVRQAGGVNLSLVTDSGTKVMR